jgi:hypothetical protein
MVLSKSGLIAALQNEEHILLHLASKIDRTQLDYRPTPKQRSTIELLRYLSLMGPMLVEVAKSGMLDDATAKAAIEVSNARDFDQTLAEIAKDKGFTRRSWRASPTRTCAAKSRCSETRRHAEHSSSTSCSVGAPRTGRNYSCTSKMRTG